MAKLKFDRNEISALLALIPADKPNSVIHLVHDEGVYLMSFDDTKAPEASHTVVYAKGLNPKKDGDVWDACNDAVGGDDFGEAVGDKAEWQAILDKSEGDIILNVTASSITTSYLPKRVPGQVVAPKPMKPLDIFKGAKSGRWRVVCDPKLEKPLYAVSFHKKADAVKFVKALKVNPTMKAMYDGVVMAQNKVASEVK